MSDPIPTALRPVRAELQVGQDRLALLRDGREAYPAMIEAIASARSTVCLETYILRSDAAGERFARALEARARAGVEVNVMYDAWGSSVSRVFLESLHAAGVRTLAFHPLALGGRAGRLVSWLWRRNHRKTLVVDGGVAFTGGLNIASDYDAPEEGGRGWRDTHVRVEGPAAARLQAVFVRTWRRAGGAVLDAPRYEQPLPAAGAPVRFLTSDFRVDGRAIRTAYLEAIRGARDRILITSAYFVPPFFTRRAICRAAQRGVDVRVIVAGATDIPLALWAARGMYRQLLRSGVRVFEWHGRVLHAKTAVIDGRWGTVGSSNLDSMALWISLEVNAVVEDAAFARALEAMFEDDLGQCREVTLEAWRRRPLRDRLWSWLAYRFRRWL